MSAMPRLGPGSLTRCAACGAETNDPVTVRVDTETARKTGFDRDVVFGYFHKEPPFEVCDPCRRRFEEWDNARIRLLMKMARESTRSGTPT